MPRAEEYIFPDSDYLATNSTDTTGYPVTLHHSSPPANNEQHVFYPPFLNEGPHSPTPGGRLVSYLKQKVLWSRLQYVHLVRHCLPFLRFIPNLL